MRRGSSGRADGLIARIPQIQRGWSERTQAADAGSKQPQPHAHSGQQTETPRGDERERGSSSSSDASGDGAHAFCADAMADCAAPMLTVRTAAAEAADSQLSAVVIATQRRHCRLAQLPLTASTDKGGTARRG
jgi:hypothetical protein